MIKTDGSPKYLSRIMTNLHQTFRTGLVFPSWTKWVQGVLCYDQNWWKLKYLSRISIDHTLAIFFWVFQLFQIISHWNGSKWPSDPQWQILPKKWLRLAQNSQFWSFCRFLHLFPQNQAQIDLGMVQFHPDSQLFPSFYHHSVSFLEKYQKIFIP